MNDNLLKLRSGLDAIASRYPQISFVSFADSVLLKSHWSLGVKYTMCISKARGWYARVLCDEILKNLTPTHQKPLTGSPPVAR